MALNKKDYPLHILTEWSDFLKEARLLCSDKDDIIEITADDGEYFSLTDRDKRFYYRISRPNFVDSKNTVGARVTRTPSNNVNNAENTFSLPFANIFENLRTWLELIEGYDKITLTPEDEIRKQYEKEFFTEFEIVDADADTAAFDHTRQVFLLGFLEKVKDELQNESKNDPTLLELVDEQKA